MPSELRSCQYNKGRACLLKIPGLELGIDITTLPISDAKPSLQPMEEEMKSHAIVIGSGIAGLFQAKVLSQFYKTVSILERDHLPKVPEHRKGVPQALHNHVFVLGGIRGARQIFPDLEKRLTDYGAIPIDWYRDLKMYRNDGWRPRYESSASGIACDRVTLEAALREAVRSSPAVREIEGEVVSLVAEASGRISGVIIERSANGGQEVISGDLVVDCSGRSGGTTKWLAALGYPPPWETQVDPLCAYSTRWYSGLSSLDRDWKLFKVAENREFGRVASIVQTAADRWVVTLQGFLGDYPPTTDEGFLEFARQLPVSDVYDAIYKAVPVSPIHAYRRMHNVWRHFEKCQIGQRVMSLLATPAAF